MTPEETPEEKSRNLCTLMANLMLEGVFPCHGAIDATTGRPLAIVLLNGALSPEERAALTIDVVAMLRAAANQLESDLFDHD